MDTGKIYFFIQRENIRSKYAENRLNKSGNRRKILKKWDKNIDPNFVQMFPEILVLLNFYPPHPRYVKSK